MDQGPGGAAPAPGLPDTTTPVWNQGQRRENNMGIEVSGLLGLIILVLDVWAIINIIGAPASPGAKLLWVLLILLLPLIGVLLWFFLGPRSRAV